MSSPYLSRGGSVSVSAAGRVNTKRLDALLRVLPARASNVAKVHANLVAYWAREFAPEQGNNDQGFKNKRNKVTIKGGIKVQRLGPTRYAIVSTAPHSATQEFGSRPHIITPREQYTFSGGRLRLQNPNGMLHFYWQNAGRFVRKQVVRHPGNPAHPFMLPARRRVAAKYYRELRQMFTPPGA